MSASRSTPGLDALAVEHVDEVLGRDVPRRVRGERAAAEAADRCVEHGRARLECGERVRVARCCACCGSGRRRGCRARRRARRATAPRSGTATPIVSARTIASGPISATRVGDLHDALGIDLALERAAERDAERHGSSGCRPRVRARRCGRAACERLLDGGALVALVERLGDAEREAHLVEPGRDEPVVTPLVQGEPGAHHARASRRRAATTSSASAICGTRRGSTKLATSIAGTPRADEAPNELGARRDVEDLGLVLQPVARADVVDGHARRYGASSHRVTLLK